MGVFDKVGQAKKAFELQRKAKAIQKELKDTLIEATELDGKIRVVFTGEQKVEEISIDPEVLNPEKKRELEIGLKNAISSALSRASQIAAEKSKDLFGDIGIPGM